MDSARNMKSEIEFTEDCEGIERELDQLDKYGWSEELKTLNRMDERGSY